MKARPLWVSARVACTAARGQGATAPSPQSASPAGVRVSVTFSSRRPSRRLLFLPAAPVQNRRRPERRFLKGECSLGDGLRNCSFGMPRLRGCPRPHISCPSVSPGDPEPPDEWALAHRTPTHQGRRCAGTAAVLHRLRRPSREQLCLRNRFLGRTVTQLRSRCASEAFGWMPHRPPASAPVGECLVPSGRAFLETVLGNGEGVFNPRG